MKFRDTLVKGTGAVVYKIETIVNLVGGFSSDIFETTGNAIHDTLNSFGNFVARIPIAGDILRALCTWMGGVLAGVGNFIGAFISGVIASIGNSLAGVIKIILGLLTLNGNLITDGLKGIAATIAGSLST